MDKYLVFNGDADGICAAHQYYLENQTQFQAVTGVKRDISLLKKIEKVENSEINVFDIAVEKNARWLNQLLGNNNRIQWFDHHISKELPAHSNLTYNIRTDVDVNTSLIVSQYLNKPQSPWAIVGLFGDNMQERASQIGRSIGFDEIQIQSLKRMGELLNYNAYGSSLEDLYFHPAAILEKLQPYLNPLEFIQNETLIDNLARGYEEDFKQIEQVEWLTRNIVLLPDQKWARRVIGDFAYQLVRNQPEQNFAVLLTIGDSFQVSIRTSSSGKKNAGKFCMGFPTGGGRKGAAGINDLPIKQLDHFIREFNRYFFSG